MSMVEFTDPELYLLRMAVFARMATAPSTEYKDLEALLPRLGYPRPKAEEPTLESRPVVREIEKCECGFDLYECANSERAAIMCSARQRRGR